MVNLQRLDLNLLVTLDVLLTEHNVTRAAQRLHLSQPSVSVHLAKLREFFNDPLLLPSPKGMQPTARAEALRDPLRLALANLGQAVSPEPVFDPLTAKHTWRIAASDYGESAVLLPVLEQLRVVAPETKLAVLGLHPSRLADQAQQGEIDLALHTGDSVYPHFHRRVLFSEKYVLAGRPGHPQLKDGMTQDQFCALEYVIVSPDGGGFRGVTDDVLSASGTSRNVVLSVPHFLLMMKVLARTDLVAMLPSRLAQTLYPLRIVEPPIDIPGYEMTMMWHERVHRDPAQIWLRQFIADTI